MARWTIPDLQAHKVSDGKPPLVAVTAYDAPTARVANDAGVDIVLVGDTVAMVVLGYPDTRSVSVDDIAYHLGAVRRADPDALIIGDLPWMSYHLSTEETVRNAATLVRSGAEAVKLEGGSKRIPAISAILDAEIPVIGHVGLTPQSSLAMGGFKVQGKSVEHGHFLVEEAKQLAHAGCSAIVIEGVPSVVGQMITEAVAIPTIGIGAGPACDGQILVFHDIVGLENRFKPKFVRRYGSSFEDQVSSITSFATDVRTGDYPSKAEEYKGDPAPGE